MKSYELRVTNKVVGVIKQILSKGLIILIVFFTLYSVILAVTYRFTKTDVLYSRNVYTSLKYPEVTPAERFSPQDIFADHLTILWENNYDLKKYYEHLQQSFNGGRSLLLLGLGQTDPLAKIEKINDFQFNLHLLANNDYKFDVSSIKVGIELRDKYELFTINNLLKDESFQIYFDCSNKMNCKSNWDGAQLTFQNRDKIEGLKDPIEFSNELKIDLSSSSKINFVDYKTKN